MDNQKVPSGRRAADTTLDDTRGPHGTIVGTYTKHDAPIGSGLKSIGSQVRLILLPPCLPRGNPHNRVERNTDEKSLRGHPKEEQCEAGGVRVCIGPRARASRGAAAITCVCVDVCICHNHRVVEDHQEKQENDKGCAPAGSRIAMVVGVVIV